MRPTRRRQFHSFYAAGRFCHRTANDSHRRAMAKSEVSPPVRRDTFGFAGSSILSLTFHRQHFTLAVLIDRSFANPGHQPHGRDAQKRGQQENLPGRGFRPVAFPGPHPLAFDAEASGKRFETCASEVMCQGQTPAKRIPGVFGHAVAIEIETGHGLAPFSLPMDRSGLFGCPARPDPARGNKDRTVFCERHPERRRKMPA